MIPAGSRARHNDAPNVSKDAANDVGIDQRANTLDIAQIARRILGTRARRKAFSEKLFSKLASSSILCLISERFASSVFVGENAAVNAAHRSRLHVTALRCVALRSRRESQESADDAQLRSR